MKSQVLSFRKCHDCGKVSLGSWPSHVAQCEHCSKYFAPFFYFDESDVPVYSDNQLRPARSVEEFSRPVLGLTALWESREDLKGR